MSALTSNELELIKESKVNFLQGFLEDWNMVLNNEYEEYVFLFFHWSNQKGDHNELLKKLIHHIKGKENQLNPLLCAMFLHYEAYFLWRIENQLLKAQNQLILAVEQLKGSSNILHIKYLGRIYDTLGLLSKSESQLKEASFMFQLAIVHKQKSDDKEGLAISYGNLGRLNMELGNYQEAIAYLNLDIELMQNFYPENLFVRAQLLSTMAWAYLENNDLSIAHEKYEESKKFNLQLKNHTGLFYNEIGFAEIALLSNNIEKSNQHCKEAKEYLDSEDFFKPAYASSYVQYVFVEALILNAEQREQEARTKLEFVLEKYHSNLNNIQEAKIYLALSKLSIENKSTLYLKHALQVLDKTEHVKLRLEVERKLRAQSESDFLLHAAGRFAGKDQLEHLIENAGEDGFQGEEKELAVLFSDIRGFTTLSEKLSPQDLITTLNRFFTLMTKIISDYGGYVDKFIGDAIMAVFSFPKEGEGDVNHCEQAVKAALHMRSELNRFKVTLGEGFEDLDVGVGIHYGKMVSGLIGSPQKRSFTVIGDAVNTASRLEGLTKQLGGSLVVSDEVIQKLQQPEKYIIRPLGSYRPKGKKNPLKLYDIPAFSGTDYWSQELMNEAEKLQLFDQLNAQDKREEAEKIMTQLLENPISNYCAGYQLLYSELHKYPSLEEYSKWDKVIDLFSK